MVGFGALWSLFATTASLLAHVDASQPRPRSPQNAGVIEGSFIVEFTHDAEGRATDNLGTHMGQDVFRDKVQSLLDLDIGVTVKNQLNYKLFSGATVYVPDHDGTGSALAQLRRHQNVKNIWPNRVFHRSQSARSNVDDAWQGQQMSMDDYQAATMDQFDDYMVNRPHYMTQVKKLHEKGIYGNGTKICVVGGGVDYLNPALGGGYGRGHVIAFGKDLVGDKYNSVKDQPIPDDDPYSNCDGHTTGVVAVIATQPGFDFGLIGVAPGATIGVYKVGSCDSGDTTALLIQAMFEAYEDGCNVITNSNADTSGWAEGLYSAQGIAAARIMRAGVVVVLGVTDQGESGLFHAGDPGSSDIIATGSVDNEVTPDIGRVGNFTIDGGEPRGFKWSPGTPAAWAGVSLPLWAPNYYDNNITDHAAPCPVPYPADTPDLSGYIVLVHYRDCNESIQAKAAADHGAKYIIQYNNWPYQKYPPDVSDVDGIVAGAGVLMYQGNEWLEALAAGSTVMITMSDPNTTARVLTFEETHTGGLVTSFSSWGPTYELDVKPQAIAPGGNLLVAWTTQVKPPYADQSGNSFSVPYMAGVCALVAQARGIWDPRIIESVLSTTADPTIWTDTLSVYPEHRAPVFQQGSGTVRAYDAAFTTTLLSKSSISLNDTDNLQPTQDFTIQNLGTEAVTFDLGHAAAATVYTLPGNQFRPQQLSGMEVTADAATIEFTSGTRVTVPASGQVTVTFSVTPPALDVRRLPMYSGWITLNGTNGENLSLAYGGAAFRMKDVQLFSEVWLVNYTANLGDYPEPSDVTPLEDGVDHIFYLPSHESTYHDDVFYPMPFIQLAFGTAFLDIHLIAWDGVEGVEPGTDVGRVQWGNRTYLPGYDPNDPDSEPWWLLFDGTMADGVSYFPEGTYVFEVRALKLLGDRDNPTDYQFKRTPPFTVKYTAPRDTGN